MGTDSADTKIGNFFRPRARVLRTLGDELISSEVVAVLELVKNAYDADATRVLIRFDGPLEIGKGQLEVIDNGHGMSLKTVQSAWMEPATITKKRATRSEEKKRRMLGEKGIGRFAASRLANYLEVITRRKDAKNETIALFDWSQFDDETRYLDEIEVLWEERSPEEICPDGTIQELWKVEEGDEALAHGTILRMGGLRTSWSEEQVERLRTDLSRLISPFFQEDEFSIRLQLPQPLEPLSGNIEPPESLKNPHYFIKGNIDGAGNYKLTVKLKDQTRTKNIKGRFTLPDGHIPECGPFFIELRVWDRDQASVSELAREYGATISNVREDLDDVAGISIYRDGFRVLPYGDPRNDWLRLDLRRVQNPTLRLSNNQIAGYVLISADENPQLRDQSNREGLMEGRALDDLRELIKLALSLIEQRRYELRHPRNSRQSSPKKGGIFSDFNITAVREFVKQRYPRDFELLKLIGEKERDIEQRVEQVQEVLARYRRLATLGQLIDTLLHDGRAPLSKVVNEVQLGLRDLKHAHGVGQEFLGRLKTRFEVIDTQTKTLSTVFRRIEPFGGRKRGRPSQISLEQTIGNAFLVLEGELNEIGVEFELPKGNIQVTVDQAEIQEVIINLLQNSLYWLRKVPKGSRQIIVQTHRISSNEVEIIFSDSGPGVDPDSRERIFDPYYSTKPDGVGLGLTIAGEIITEYYAGSLELLEAGPLPGTTFRITLRRRV